MIEKIEKESQTGAPEDQALVNSFCGLINKVDKISNETVSFDSEALSINWFCEKKKNLEPNKSSKKALQASLAPMSTEFYKAWPY